MTHAPRRRRFEAPIWTRLDEPVRLGGAVGFSMETDRMGARVFFTLLAAIWIALLAACSPKVQIQAPTEPITINLNVKIEHEIRVKVDQDLENLFDKEDDIF